MIATRNTSLRPEFSREFLDDLLVLTDMEQLVAEHTQLMPINRMGTLGGKCPMHHEYTGSFLLRSSGVFQCLGCGKSGNAFDFVLGVRGGSFGDAVRYLASRAKVATY